MEIKFLLIMRVKSVIPIGVPRTYTKELMGEPTGSQASMTIRDGFSLTLHQRVCTSHVFTFKQDSLYEL